MQDDEKLVQNAIEILKARRKGKGAGSITDADIARVLDVHSTTLHRWLRGESTPQDKETIKRLITLSQQASLWYRRVCPFILAVYVPSDIGNSKPHAELFDQVIFEPAKGAEVLRVKLRCTIDFDALSFIVIGTDRGNVGLGYGKLGPFSSCIRLPEKRNPAIKKGDLIEIYMKYDI